MERRSYEGWYGGATAMALWASMLFNGGSSQRLALVLRLVPYLLKVYVALMLYPGVSFPTFFIAENLVN